MSTHVLTKADANLDLALWNAEAESVASSDLYLWLRESGLPSEVAIRLINLADSVVEVADRIISIGKIILIKIIEFVKAHSNLLIGIAIGAAIGALVNLVPFLGSFLSPIAIALGVTVGAISGHRLDKRNKGQAANTDVNPIVIMEDVIEIAKEFFKLLSDTFNAMFDKQFMNGF